MRAPVAVEAAELHEVGVGDGDLVVEGAQFGDQAVAFGLELVDVLQERVGVLQRGERGGLGDGGQVVGQPDELDGVHDGGVGGEIAEPQSGGAERLGHGAADDQVRAAFEQRQQRVAVAELDVRLVGDDHGRLGVLRGLVEGADRVGGDRVAGGVVGGGDEDDVGAVLGDGPGGVGLVEGEVVAAGSVDPAGAGAPGDERVHRVRGLEAERGAAGAAEGLEELLDDLVGAVGGPDVRQGHRVLAGTGEVGGERGAQLDGVPVGVAVQLPGGLADALGDPLDQGVGQRVGVLVGVQPDGDVELRGAVGRPAAQFVPDGEVVDAGHLLWGTFHPNRAFTAAPCAGRSSASARVTTWWATSASASRV